MFSLSYTAGEHLAHELAQANAPEDAVIRVVADEGQLGLIIDTVQPGDTTFAHAERTVLVIDTQISESLADKRLDLHVQYDEAELVFVKQLLE